MNSIDDMIEKGSHSGADFKTFFNEYNIKYVRKILENSPRNIASLKKQKYFRSNAFSRAVNIEISIDTISDILIADMPFEEGICGEQYAVKASKNESDLLRVALEEYLQKMYRKCTIVDLDLKLYLSKISDLELAIQKNTFFNDLEGFIRSVFNRLKKLLNISEGLVCLKTEPHGDLTLSNIICKADDDVVKLIDFLDVFDKNLILDLCKLKQDMKYGWSARKLKNECKLRFSLFCLSSTPPKYSYLVDRYYREMHIVGVLNILRIIPYCSDGVTKEWIIKSLKREIDECKGI